MAKSKAKAVKKDDGPKITHATREGGTTTTHYSDGGTSTIHHANEEAAKEYVASLKGAK